MQEIGLTSQGVHELERELDRLRARYESAEVDVAEAMERAGDADEVGECLDVQRDQELLARRITMLESWLRGARVRDYASRPHDTAELGARAEFKDLDTGELACFELVASPESSIERGRLSVDSPVGHALLGHHEGETVELVTPKGRRRLRVVSVS